MLARLAMAMFLLLAGLSRAADRPSVPLDRQGDPLPPGALARLGTLRFRPAEPYFVVQLSPDGKTVATGEPFKVRLWDPDKGKERLVVPDLAYRIFFLRFSPDGKYLLAIGDHQGQVSRDWSDSHSVWVIEVATGKVLLQVDGREKEQGLVSADFLDGGKTIVVFDRRGIFRQVHGVELWDLAQRKRR